MIKPETAQLIYDVLYSDEMVNVYAILDGASVPDLLNSLAQHQPEYECLYRGALRDDIAQVAPYLVRLDPTNDFTPWVVENGWGAHWGIFVMAEVELAFLRRHFRKFLTVFDPDGMPLLFRYYDPRVLRIYLPTCNSSELETIFGPTLCFLTEAEDPGLLLRFEHTDGSLAQEEISLANPG